MRNQLCFYRKWQNAFRKRRRRNSGGVAAEDRRAIVKVYSKLMYFT